MSPHESYRGTLSARSLTRAQIVHCCAYCAIGTNPYRNLTALLLFNRLSLLAVVALLFERMLSA